MNRLVSSTRIGENSLFHGMSQQKVPLSSILNCLMVNSPSTKAITKLPLEPLLFGLAACVPSVRMTPREWCAMSLVWLKMHTRLSPRSLVVSSFYASSTLLFVVNYLMEVCPLSCGIMLQSLSPPLQRGVCFLHRHLPTSRSVALAIDLPFLAR